ncbi:MAG: hypothetical protein ACRDRQ_08900 [Pseudonocardiaceae bacterium]
MPATPEVEKMKARTSVPAPDTGATTATVIEKTVTSCPAAASDTASSLAISATPQATQAGLDAMRRRLGALLAAYRGAAGLSQPELGRAIGRTMTGIDGELAGELMAVVTKLVRSIGRRDAMRVARWTLTAMGLSGLDTDECTRLAQAVASPRRVDAQIVENLAITLAQCKRLEDKLGPCEVLDTAVAQHQIVRHLVEGGCPENMAKPL